MSQRWALLLCAAAGVYMLWLVCLPAAAPTAAPLPSPAAAASPPPTQTPAPRPSDSPVPEALPEIKLKNDTDLPVDVPALSAEPLTQKLAPEGVQVLILHTHGTEAYAPEPGREYAATDPYRTTDPEYSVIRVGEVLAAALQRQGLQVAHDTGLYDYPRYAGAYDRSEAAIRTWLERCPTIAVVIDLHRDALGSGKTPYKTLSSLSGGAAQVMLVAGTGENGLAHPRWRENLKLALALQRSMDQRCPTLTRPLELVRERYNQHLTTGSLILEVGTNGNTLTEAERAAELFALAAGPVFLSLVDY